MRKREWHKNVLLRDKNAEARRWKGIAPPPPSPHRGRVDVEYLATTASSRMAASLRRVTSELVSTRIFLFFARATALLLAHPPFLFSFLFFFFVGIFHLIYAILVGRTLCLSYLEFGIIDNFYLFFRRLRRRRRDGFFCRCIAKVLLLVEFLFVYFFASLADCSADLFFSDRIRRLYRFSYYCTVRRRLRLFGIEDVNNRKIRTFE